MRVVDTPITELGFAGVGVGAAMVGLRPVIEFMTWNFALLALDQVVNAAAKMLYMSGGQYNMPIVFRGPNGAALQLSAQHSQAWESLARAHPGPQGRRARHAVRREGPAQERHPRRQPGLFLEGEMLYNTKGEVPDEEYVIPHRQGGAEARGRPLLDHHARQDGARRDAGAPTSWRRKASASTSSTCARSARWTSTRSRASVRKTNRAVVLEEGWEICGVGAQVVDYIQRDCFDDLDAPVVRVHQADVPMPYAKNLENAPPSPTLPKAIAAVQESHVPRLGPTESRQWQPKSSWRRSPRRWRRDASSSGSRTRATRQERRDARRGRDRQGDHGARRARRRRAAQAPHRRGRRRRPVGTLIG